MTKAMQRIRFSLTYTFFLTCSLKKKKKRYTLTLSNCVNLTTEYIALAPKKKKKNPIPMTLNYYQYFKGSENVIILFSWLLAF